MVLEKHKELTAVRARTYAELFGCSPSSILPPHALFKKPDERFLIDIFVYTLATSTGDIDVAVTNGMSDRRMADLYDPLRSLSRQASLPSVHGRRAEMRPVPLCQCT
jgi:hypothetical protein